MFLTDPDFRKHVAGYFKVAVESLAGYWDDVAKKAHESAYFDIRGALLARGFTASQIDNWDRGEEFERDIGLFWCGVKGDWPGTDLERIKLLDRREELLTVPVEVDSGTPQVPSGSPMRIVAGVFSTVQLDGTDDPWTRDTAI